MRIVVPTDLNPPAVPPGIYKARISGQKQTVSKNSGNTQLQLELTILSQGPSADVKTIGRKLSDFIPILESTLFRLNAPYKAVTGIDIPAREYSEEELISTVVGAILQQEVVISVQTREYQGQLRTEVGSYKSAQG